MQYKLEEYENGEYAKVKDDGKKYIINECNAAYTPEGLNVGYTEFADEAACLKAWKLVKVERDRFRAPIQAPTPTPVA